MVKVNQCLEQPGPDVQPRCPSKFFKRELQCTNLQLCQGKRLLETMDLTFLLIKNKQRQQKMSKNVYSSKTITTYKLKKIIKKLNAHKIIIKLKDSFLWSSFHIPVLTLKLLATNAKDFITISVVIQIKYTSHPMAITDWNL